MYESRVLNELASEGTSRNLCRAYVLAVMTLDVKSVSTECLKNMGCLFLLIKRQCFGLNVINPNVNISYYIKEKGV